MFIRLYIFTWFIDSWTDKLMSKGWVCLPLMLTVTKVSWCSGTKVVTMISCQNFKIYHRHER